MKRTLVFFALLFAGAALAAATYTPSGWQLVNSAGTTDQPSYAACVSALKAQPLPARQRTDYCREKWVTRATADPPPPPAPVDCAVSPWVEVAGDWSACVNGSQTRTISRARTVTTQSANGGLACPALTGSSVEARACTVPVPDPVPTPDPTPTGQVITVSAGESISAAVAKLEPGGTVVVKPGTYAAFSLKACAAASWCTVRAETDGTVILPNLNIGPGNWYTRIEGLRFEGSAGSKITGSFVKVFRSAFKGGPAKGNDVSLAIGTNDRTPGASDILIEDSWIHGPGGRYKVLVYNAQRVVLRRVLARHDGGWTFDGNNPQAGFSLYDSKDVVCENCGFVDPVPGLSPFETGIYLVSNGTTSTHSTNVSVVGSFVIDSPNNGIAAEGVSAASYNVTDLLVSRGKAGAVNTNGAAHSLTVTGLTANVGGIVAAKWASSGSVRVTNCKIVKGTASSGASLSNCPGGTGADLARRIGVSGTLFGEPGFDAVTADPLFPWPNEERIKADFDAVRAAFGGRSLTGYVQGAAP